MKYFNISILALIIGALTLFSCSKEETNSSIKESPQKQFTQTYAGRYDDFMQIDPVQLGLMHNSVLSEILQIQNNDNNLSLLEAVQQTTVNLTTEQKNQAYYYIESHRDVEISKQFILDNLSSQNSKDIFETMYNSVSNIGSYESLVNQLDAQLIIANSQTEGFDLQALKIFAEGSKASADFWLNQYVPVDNTEQVADWVKADGVGVAQASIGWAITAAFVGGGPAGYFIGCAVAGGIASAWG